LLARDAMGIKLIYYKLSHDTLTFGSEIRPVLAAENHRPEVDPTALNLFLRFRYTPSPLTIYKEMCASWPRHDAGGRERRLPGGTLVPVHPGAV